MVHEDEIRDLLAEDIEFLERGLRLIKKNYRLTNADGTYGSVDLLAQDSAGAFVVIELKKTRQASRQALHEISKYVELLSRSKGVPADEVRAIIVSTDWEELLVPFSHWHSQCNYQLTGMRLELEADDRTPDKIEIVEALPPVIERGLTPVHGLIFGPDSNALRGVWSDVLDRLRAVGCDDALGIILRNAHDGDAALYFALGRMSSADPRTQPLDRWETPEDSVEAPEGCSLEYSALCELSLAGYEGWSGAYPEKYAALTEQLGWTATDLLREGVFSKQEDLYSDEQLLLMVSGDAGDGLIRVQIQARPINRPHWEKFRSRILRTLVGAEGWEEGISAWLAEREADSKLFDIRVNLFNPADFASCLVHVGQRPDLGAQIFPELHAAVDAPNPHNRQLVGVLSWDGVPRNLTAAFEEVYFEDWTWVIARATGSIWEYDQRLTRKWGLSYILTEFSATYPDGALLSHKDGELVRTPFVLDDDGVPTHQGIAPLQDFLVAHQSELHEIVERLSTNIVDLGAGVQMYGESPGPTAPE